MKGIGCSPFTSTSISFKPLPLFPRPGRLDLYGNVFYSNHSTRVESFCSHRCTSSSSSNFHSLDPPSYSKLGVPNVRNELFYKFQVFRWVSEGSSGLQKAGFPSAVLVLSALTVAIIQPLFANSAFAADSTIVAVRGLIQSELLNTACTGFFAGCLHTLSGPDHLAALAPLTIGRSRAESAAVGALWGCGHDAGQLIFGLFFLILKDRFHIEVLRAWGTRVVGLTLLVIGLMGMREASELHTPGVPMENANDDDSKARKKKMGSAMFATGIVHGLQPDSLMMILPALALPSRLASAAFLSMFLVGTVVSMSGYTVFIGSCTEALKERVPRVTEKLTWVSSFVALALGCAIFISQYIGMSLY